MNSLAPEIAHETGHVLIGCGHPDAPMANSRGPTELPATKGVERLMCSGRKPRNDRSSRLLVKQEWDSAEVWLSNRSNGDH